MSVTTINIHKKIKPTLKPKAQPMLATKRVMTWFSMCSTDESTSVPKKNAYRLHARVVLILNVVGFLSSSTFCVKFIRTDFDISTFAFMETTIQFGAIYFFIMATRMRLQFDQIFNGLWDIFKSRKLNPVRNVRISNIPF